MTSPSVLPPPREAPNALFELLIRLGDDRLVLGSRLSEETTIIGRRVTERPSRSPGPGCACGGTVPAR